MKKIIFIILLFPLLFSLTAKTALFLEHSDNGLVVHLYKISPDVKIDKNIEDYLIANNGKITSEYEGKVEEIKEKKVDVFYYDNNGNKVVLCEGKAPLSCSISEDLYRKKALTVYAEFKGDDELSSSLTSTTFYSSSSAPFSIVSSLLRTNVSFSNPLCFLSFFLFGVLIATMYLSGKNPLALFDISIIKSRYKLKSVKFDLSHNFQVSSLKESTQQAKKRMEETIKEIARSMGITTEIKKKGIEFVNEVEKAVKEKEKKELSKEDKERVKLLRESILLYKDLDKTGKALNEAYSGGKLGKVAKVFGKIPGMKPLGIALGAASVGFNKMVRDTIKFIAFPFKVKRSKEGIFYIGEKPYWKYDTKTLKEIPFLYKNLKKSLEDTIINNYIFYRLISDFKDNKLIKNIHSNSLFSYLYDDYSKLLREVEKRNVIWLDKLKEVYKKEGKKGVLKFIFNNKQPKCIKKSNWYKEIEEVYKGIKQIDRSKKDDYEKLVALEGYLKTINKKKLSTNLNLVLSGKKIKDWRTFIFFEGGKFFDKERNDLPFALFFNNLSDLYKRGYKLEDIYKVNYLKYRSLFLGNRPLDFGKIVVDGKTQDALTYFLSRDPKLFVHVLNDLRDNKIKKKLAELILREGLFKEGKLKNINNKLKEALKYDGIELPKFEKLDEKTKEEIKKLFISLKNRIKNRIKSKDVNSFYNNEFKKIMKYELDNDLEDILIGSSLSLVVNSLDNEEKDKVKEQFAKKLDELEARFFFDLLSEKGLDKLKEMIKDKLRDKKEKYIKIINEIRDKLKLENKTIEEVIDILFERYRENKEELYSLLESILKKRDKKGNLLFYYMLYEPEIAGKGAVVLHETYPKEYWKGDMNFLWHVNLGEVPNAPEHTAFGFLIAGRYTKGMNPSSLSPEEELKLNISNRIGNILMGSAESVFEEGEIKPHIYTDLHNRIESIKEYIENYKKVFDAKSYKELLEKVEGGIKISEIAKKAGVVTKEGTFIPLSKVIGVSDRDYVVGLYFVYDPKYGFKIFDAKHQGQYKDKTLKSIQEDLSYLRELDFSNLHELKKLKKNIKNEELKKIYEDIISNLKKLESKKLNINKIKDIREFSKYLNEISGARKIGLSNEKLDNVYKKILNEIKRINPFENEKKAEHFISIIKDYLNKIDLDKVKGRNKFENAVIEGLKELKELTKKKEVDKKTIIRLFEIYINNLDPIAIDLEKESLQTKYDKYARDLLYLSFILKGNVGKTLGYLSEEMLHSKKRPLTEKEKEKLIEVLNNDHSVDAMAKAVFASKIAKDLGYIDIQRKLNFIGVISIDKFKEYLEKTKKSKLFNKFREVSEILKRYDLSEGLSVNKLREKDKEKLLGILKEIPSPSIEEEKIKTTEEKVKNALEDLKKKLEEGGILEDETVAIFLESQRSRPYTVDRLLSRAFNSIPYTFLLPIRSLLDRWFSFDLIGNLAQRSLVFADYMTREDRERLSKVVALSELSRSRAQRVAYALAKSSLIKDIKLKKRVLKALERYQTTWSLTITRDPRAGTTQEGKSPTLDTMYHRGPMMLSSPAFLRKMGSEGTLGGFFGTASYYLPGFLFNRWAPWIGKYPALLNRALIQTMIWHPSIYNPKRTIYGTVNPYSSWPSTPFRFLDDVLLRLLPNPFSNLFGKKSFLARKELGGEPHINGLIQAPEEYQRWVNYGYSVHFTDAANPNLSHINWRGESRIDPRIAFYLTEYWGYKDRYLEQQAKFTMERHEIAAPEKIYNIWKRYGGEKFTWEESPAWFPVLYTAYYRYFIKPFYSPTSPTVSRFKLDYFFKEKKGKKELNWENIPVSLLNAGLLVWSYFNPWGLGTWIGLNYTPGTIVREWIRGTPSFLRSLGKEGFKSTFREIKYNQLISQKYPSLWWKIWGKEKINFKEEFLGELKDVNVCPYCGYGFVVRGAKCPVCGRVVR